MTNSLCKLVNTEGTGYLSCAKKHHNLVTNIVGVKGTDGSRKRPRGTSGGWRTNWHGCVPTRTSSTSWRSAKRRSQAQITSSGTGESNNINDCDKIQVDEPSNNQVTNVVKPMHNVATILENMEVDKVRNAVLSSQRVMVPRAPTQVNGWITLSKPAGWPTFSKPADSVFKTNVTTNKCLHWASEI